jgi:hypothetical protein
MIVPDAALLWTVWTGSALIWLGLSLLVWRRSKLPRLPAALIILLIAAAVRLGYALLMPPALSDDLWRYLFDGQTLASGHNPYAIAPQRVIDAEAEQSGSPLAWMRQINNPELVTIYQPVSQYVFAATAWSAERFLGPAYRIDALSSAFRVLFNLFDLGIVLLLLGQLRARGRSPWWAVLYAWNPLVIAEVAWSGHQDGLGILPLLGALVLAQRAARSWRAAVGAGVLLGLAVGVKPIALGVALPMAWHVWRQRRGWAGFRRVAAAAGVCGLSLGLLYLPFVLMDGGLGGMLDTSRRFVSAWRFNGSIHPLVEAAWGGSAVASAKPLADLACAAALLLTLLLATPFQRDAWQTAAVYFLALVCLTSTAHPWYLLWALALLPVAWSAGRCAVGPAVWVAGLTLPWSYQAWLNFAAGQGYVTDPAVQWAVWVPVYVALGGGIVTSWKRGRTAPPLRRSGLPETAR